MRKVRYYILSITFLSFLNACGPSAAEQAQIQQHRDDSITHAVERKRDLESELEGSYNRLKVYQDNLKLAIAQLEVEKDNMNKVKDFHVLRTNAEREEQIQTQSLKTQNAEENVSTINQNISEIQNRIEAIKSEMQKYQ